VEIVGIRGKRGEKGDIITTRLQEAVEWGAVSGQHCIVEVERSGDGGGVEVEVETTCQR